MARNGTETNVPSPWFPQTLMAVREDDHGDEVYTTAKQESNTHCNVWTMALETSIEEPLTCRTEPHCVHHGKPQ